ncbi:lipopolysaccharide kinase InaA family protein [Parendozoicomonas sp. Alg238-R29]|uniref:lipopolysaccharide kinase InaA family protein n=1 Tax=Parendozoicomonas sp. Alg238-R29 TaxID=2993446 RepID=UPI00248E7236|nr:lipopolysaccharide kinase InaA family protein [Parendozoicomonas sp. Alg238-R29]
MTETTNAPLPAITANSLPALKEAPETPFLLSTSSGELTCESVLRFLPGKRLVVKAELNGRKVVTKCFYGEKAERDLKRELDGINGFINSGVNTPELVAHCSNPELSIAATACLEPVESFEQVWHKELSDEERKRWLTEIACILASMHKAGVCQHDIHLDNLLLHKDELFLIDGGGARVSKTLQPKDALENLALFQAVLYPKYDKFIPDLWSTYDQKVPVFTQKFSLKNFSLLVQQKRKWRERFVQKSLRNCTQFRVSKSWHEFLSVNKSEDSPELQALLANPEPYIEAGTVLKRGKTNTVSIVTLDNGIQVFVKRYKSKKGFLHKYLRCLTRSRARISWLNGHLLDMLGVNTPTPLAMKENRFGPITTCSYIVTLFQPSPHLLEWFIQETLPENCKDVRDEVGDMLESLKRALIFHGDMKATNILLINGKPSLIDLDAMKSYKDPKKFRKVHKQDVKRFARNWENTPKAAALFESIIRRLYSDLDT